jgi:hypothetical protein
MRIASTEVKIHDLLQMLDFSPSPDAAVMIPLTSVVFFEIRYAQRPKLPSAFTAAMQRRLANSAKLFERLIGTLWVAGCCKRG